MYVATNPDQFDHVLDVVRWWNGGVVYIGGERFRVRLKSNQDGTALITYTSVNGRCQPGKPCPDTLFYTHSGPGVAYPFRVDVTFREQPATLVNVGLARIQ